MATGLQAVVITPSRTIDVGRYITSAGWTTNALGGFGSASFTLPGDPSYWLPRTLKLSLVRLMQDETIVFEGQIEDHDYSVADGEMSTTVQCFGLARLLSENSVRRIWLKRDINWQEIPGGFGATFSDAIKDNLDVSIGQYDPADLSQTGVRFAGNGSTSMATAHGNAVIFTLPSGIYCTSLSAFLTFAGANTGAGKLVANLEASANGTTWTGLAAYANTTGSAILLATIPANAQHVALVVRNEGAGAITPTSADSIAFQSIALFGSTHTGPDSGAGFYGGTIMNDLVALCPGLTAGIIETGSDFVIEAIERTVRTACLDVVQEVAGYYSKEWGVYENGRFDWKDVNLDETNWIADVSELKSLNLRSSVDEVSSREFVLYTDAASDLEMESSASSTNRANPYVLRSRNKDVLTSPGFPMTTNTSAQLAARLSAARGQEPFASGTCSLTYRTSVTKARGGAAPAFQIRAGQNIKITGLPKSNPFDTGRDGETLFHIVSTETSLDGTVTLTLDSQEHAIDALLARLAAVTRTLTG